MSSSRPLVLLVDDDKSIREATCDYLEQWGFDARGAANGREADALMLRETPDAVILDIMMPGEDGLAICRRLGGRYPVLMLSARGDASDRIVGLEVGADDYLPKPFDPRELVARLRAIMRRRTASPKEGGGSVLEFEGWRLNAEAHMLLDKEGREVPLTGGEFTLLLAFLTKPRQVLSRERLLQLTQGSLSDSYERAVDLAVSRLRRKLAARGGHFIRTVWGEGYRFDPPVQQAQS